MSEPDFVLNAAARKRLIATGPPPGLTLIDLTDDDEHLVETSKAAPGAVGTAPGPRKRQIPLASDRTKASSIKPAFSAPSRRVDEARLPPAPEILRAPDDPQLKRRAAPSAHPIQVNEEKISSDDGGEPPQQDGKSTEALNEQLEDKTRQILALEKEIELQKEKVSQYKRKLEDEKAAHAKTQREADKGGKDDEALAEAQATWEREKAAWQREKAAWAEEKKALEDESNRAKKAAKTLSEELKKRVAMAEKQAQKIGALEGEMDAAARAAGAELLAEKERLEAQHNEAIERAEAQHKEALARLEAQLKEAQAKVQQGGSASMIVERKDKEIALLKAQNAELRREEKSAANALRAGATYDSAAAELKHRRDLVDLEKRHTEELASQRAQWDDDHEAEKAAIEAAEEEMKGVYDRVEDLGRYMYLFHALIEHNRLVWLSDADKSRFLAEFGLKTAAGAAAPSSAEASAGPSSPFTFGKEKRKKRSRDAEDSEDKRPDKRPRNAE